ncbi:MAG TPA: hypothetical protein VIF43_02815 [Patescibacteria group bacterium]|jgi:hypothetical protein
MSEKHTPDFEPRVDQDPHFDKATVEALKGPAALREVWEAGSKDQVEITGYLGTYDGKQFMEVSYGPDNRAPVALGDLRFSRDRERELQDAGVDLEALLKPDPTDFEESPHEYERVYHRVSREQKKQIVRTAYNEAGGLMVRAEELYREAELADVRANIEQSKTYGAEWSKGDIDKAEQEAIANLEASAPKEYLEQAVAEARRPGELRESLEDSLSKEPEDERTVLRTEASRWVDFLERHHAGENVQARADEAVELAKEFEQAFAESSQTPELKQEMREKLFDAIEQRVEELTDQYRSRQERFQQAIEWMQNLIKNGYPTGERQPSDAAGEVVEYGRDRLQTWKKRLTGRFAKAYGIALIASLVIAPPVAGVLIGAGVMGAKIAGLYEGARALVFGSGGAVSKGIEKSADTLLQRAKKRRFRKMLGKKQKRQPGLFRRVAKRARQRIEDLR